MLEFDDNNYKVTSQKQSKMFILEVFIFISSFDIPDCVPFGVLYHIKKADYLYA